MQPRKPGFDSRAESYFPTSLALLSFATTKYINDFFVHQSYLYFNDFLPSTLKLPTITSTVGNSHGTKQSWVTARKYKEVTKFLWPIGRPLVCQPENLGFDSRAGTFPHCFFNCYFYHYIRQQTGININLYC